MVNKWHYDANRNGHEYSGYERDGRDTETRQRHVYVIRYGIPGGYGSGM